MSLVYDEGIYIHSVVYWCHWYMMGEYIYTFSGLLVSLVYDEGIYIHSVVYWCHWYMMGGKNIYIYIYIQWFTGVTGI